MATPQQKAFCVLEFAKTNAIVTVQRAFRTEFGITKLEGMYNTCVQARVFYCFSFFEISHDDVGVFFLNHPVLLSTLEAMCV